MLTPKTEAELCEIVAGSAGALRIQGGGTRPLGRPVAGDLLSLAELSGIELYEPGALTIVAKAGTPLAEIEAALAADNQRLPFEPMDHRTLLGTEGVPTIGGVVAANVSGPRRIQAGACRDSLIGVRFVDGMGAAIKNGGRVMKNVTGYDLVKLLAGSYGTLGVLSEVAFKVLPGIEASGCVMIDGLSDAKAVEVMSAALGSPFEISGAAHFPKGIDGHPITMLRLEGFTNSVAYRIRQVSEIVSAYGSVRTERDPEVMKASWAAIRDAAVFADRSGDVWRLSVKPSDAPGVAEMIGGDVFYDWGGGLIWALVSEGTDLRAKLSGFAGHATLIRASAATRSALSVFHPQAAPIQALSDGLRAKFDPRGILNPGLMA
ncbi:MAG: glycolate oxidase FAD binding subunit [Paracoccaceae bacterium]|jgi:glycolate oxidase FAD binding subunit